MMKVLAHFWNALPGRLQFWLSHLNAIFLSTGWSAFLIRPYCVWQYGSTGVLSTHIPGSGFAHYLSFQDFFTRRLRELPTILTVMIWPCDGLLCDSFEFDSGEQRVSVKGDSLPVRNVFGAAGDSIPHGYSYTNVFLHNRDYHRIHAPISGEITQIERIPGELMFLRPWLYPSNPSKPALVNERVVVTIKDEKSRPWYLSIVGGPGVATIDISPDVKIGTQVLVGSEMAAFRMGSTCCMASPVFDLASVHARIKFGSQYG